MIRSFSLLALFKALTLSTEARAQDLQSPFLKPTAFSVVKAEEGAAKAVGQKQDSTRVTARVEVPGRQIVAFNVKNSKLDSFTDDKDTDLIALPAAGGRASLPIQLDGQFGGVANVIHFNAPTCPAKGATKVRIKGSIAALVGKDEKDIEKKDVDLKKGVDLEFGTLKRFLSPSTGFGMRRNPDAHYLSRREATQIGHAA